MINKKVIILNGRGGVGKDTFVDLCGEFCRALHTSSVKPIKKLAEEIGWDGTKDEKSRKFLSDLKDLTTEFNDYPFNWLCNEYETFMSDMNLYEVLFIDIREPKEVERAKQAFNAITALIKNKNIPLIVSNHADREAENYNYDYVINNDNTLEELREVAKDFVEKVIKV